MLQGQLVKIFAARSNPRGVFAPAEPGTVVEVNLAEIIVAAGAGEYLALEQLQFTGKRRQSAEEIIRGRRIKTGDQFTRCP